MISKNHIEDFTESEFLAFVGEFFENRSGLKGAALGQHLDDLALKFEEIIENPLGSDLIYYPGDDADDSPQGVVNRVKAWRAANGKPGFKAA